MKYAGDFGASQAGQSSIGYVDFDLSSQRGDSAAFTVSDAHLLFSGSYERHGRDLIISDQKHHLVVPNYFHGDRRPLLLSPDGAPLDPAIVDALTGHTEGKVSRNYGEYYIRGVLYPAIKTMLSPFDIPEDHDH